MGLSRVSIDRATLPAAILPLAKQHMRVDFTRDDEYITNCVQRALDQFQRLTQWNVFGQIWTWRISEVAISYDCLSIAYPNVMPFTSAWTVPIGPVTSHEVAIDSIDVTTNYELWSNTDRDTYGTSYMIQTGTVGIPDPAVDPIPVAALTVGYEGLDDVPPALLDCILRMSAWYYENREMVAMPGVDVMDYFNSLLAAYWVPRC
jgi:hypothetical protein